MKQAKIDALWDEWNKETAKRHESEPIFECKNLKELDKRIYDKKTRDVILEMTDRIIKKFKPDKVILFGSQARGQTRKNSDIDLLVIFKNNIDSFKKMITIRVFVADKSPIFTDVVAATRKELKEHGDSYAHVYYYAIRNGLVLYIDGNEGALLKLSQSKDSLKTCRESVKNRHIKYSATDNAYMAIKRAFQATFIAENMPHPDTGDLDKIKNMMSDWDAKNLYGDLSQMTALRIIPRVARRDYTDTEIKQAVKIATDIYKSVEKEFKTRGIH